MKVCITL